MQEVIKESPIAQIEEINKKTQKKMDDLGQESSNSQFLNMQISDVPVTKIETSFQ